MTLNKYFKIARINKNLSQNKIAKLLGYKNGQYISNFERGKCPLPLNIVVKLCTIYNLKLKKVYELMIEDYANKLKKSFSA